MGRKKTDDFNNQFLGIVAIIVVAIFVIGVIIIFAKSLFSGVEVDIPKGLDTATVTKSAQVTQAAETKESEKTPSKTEKGESTTKESETTPAEEGLGTKTVTEYAYLREAPSPEGAQIICMSPGIVVTVLTEADENGYVKATFNNSGTQLTGYVHSSYLA